MPNFKSTFGKEETDKNLQYDNTAFIHFAISLMVASIFLLVFLVLRKFVKDRQSKLLRQVKNNPIFSRQVEVEKKLAAKRARSSDVLIKLGLIVGLLLTTYFAIHYVQEEGTKLQGFDPYELLGLEYGAPPEKIKKAFRYALS